MIRVYIKQAWQAVRQNRFFSFIYVVGTASSITMVMILSIGYLIKTKSYYPELHRDRLFYVDQIRATTKDTVNFYAEVHMSSYKTVKECFYSLQTPEAVSATLMQVDNLCHIRVPHTDIDRLSFTQYIDDRFWQVYQYRFIDGKPFSREEFEVGASVAVISESLAKELFPSGNIVGKEINVGSKGYRICGVVSDGSHVLTRSFGLLFVPYTTDAFYQGGEVDEEFMLGLFRVTILAKKRGDLNKIRTEIEEKISLYTAPLSKNISLCGQPSDVLSTTLRYGRFINQDNAFIVCGIVLLLFLMIPAMNLSNLNNSRIEKRLSELGIRKAFGANNKTLIVQLLVENFLLTIMGSFIGLLFAYVVITIYSVELTDSFALSFAGSSAFAKESNGLRLEMFLNVSVFGLALGFALLVNLLSAYLPAYRFCRQSIVCALSRNTSYHK